METLIEIIKELRAENADLKAEGKSYATVSNVGGLECGKCHY